MAFRRERVVQTLCEAMAALSTGWDSLEQALQQRLAALIREHGPRIAQVDPPNVADAVDRLLRELWALRDRLPQPVVQALQAGLEPEGRPAGVPLPTQISDAERHQVLASLVRIVDFRVFSYPARLAAELSAYIAAHQDRLTDEERQRWLELDRRYQDGGDPTTYLEGVEALLGGIEAVRRRLERGKAWRPEVYRELVPPVKAVGPGGAEAPASEATAAELLRYANVHFPATVLLTQRSVPLIVHIAQQYHEAGARIEREWAALRLRVGDLALVLHAEGFEVVRGIGGQAVQGQPSVRRVRVEADRDCEPVIFFLDPQTPGRKRIGIDVYQFDRHIAMLAFETEVVDQEALSSWTNVSVEPVPIISPGEGALPPDLELRVSLGADRRTLYYTLHSPGSSDYNFQPVGVRELLTDPWAFLQPTLDRLSTLARCPAEARSPAETSRALQELADIGANLYQDLFPEALKREYRKLRDKYRGKSLLITSDEPWIPWEMVRPVESDENGNVLYDDPHLCEMFRVSRWLAGRGAPDQVRVRQGAWVAPPDNLQAARLEQEYFAQLHRQQWEITMVGPLSTVPEVEEQFQAGATELFHFACHGNFNTEDPDESKLRLGSDYLRPSQITGLKQAGLRRARPLVFLNACHSAERGFALTRIGGWAQRFLEAGASAFIGSLWEVNDRLAACFAQEFYNRLWGLAGHQPQPLGQAFYEARMAVKQLDPANPTWLAYVLYGDPLGRIQLG